MIGFDLAFLQARAEAHGIPFEIGRGPGAMRLSSTRDRSNDGGSYDQAAIPGRVVLDGIRLLRGAFIRMESYSLDFVSRKVVGEGKTIEGRDRVAEILRTWEEDREAFVRYNLRDATLVLEILDKLDLVPLAVERTLLTGMPPDRVSASVASFDFLYLSELSKRGLAAPSVGALRSRVGRLRRDRAPARGRALRQRAGVRLQEPLPLDHPHLRDRSAGLPGLGARDASRTR